MKIEVKGEDFTLFIDDIEQGTGTSNVKYDKGMIECGAGKPKRVLMMSKLLKRSENLTR